MEQRHQRVQITRLPWRPSAGHFRRSLARATDDINHIIDTATSFETLQVLLHNHRTTLNTHRKTSNQLSMSYGCAVFVFVRYFTFGTYAGLSLSPFCFTCFPEGFCSVLDGPLSDARVLPALRLVAQAGSQQLGATCRQHRYVSETDTSREKGYA